LIVKWYQSHERWRIDGREKGAPIQLPWWRFREPGTEMLDTGSEYKNHPEMMTYKRSIVAKRRRKGYEPPKHGLFDITPSSLSLSVFLSLSQ
jgi:hypothetical protein